jgi:glycopeptide antibiotics resistance protein
VTAVLLIAALIVYGTLYPWTFQSNPNADPLLIFRMFPSFSTRRTIYDIVLNVLLYTPFGLAVYLRLRRATGSMGAALAAVGCSFALSFSLEYAQFFQRGRFPSGLDLVMNTAGGGAGVLAADLWSKLSPGLRLPSGPSLILWPIWIFALLFPLIPSIDRWTLWVKLQAASRFSLAVFIGGTLQWFIGGVILAGRRRSWILATLLLIPAQLAILGKQPTLALLTGAILGGALAMRPMRPAPTTVLALGLLVLWGLAPFRIGPVQSFAWVPFADAMGDSRNSAVVAILTKCFIYGGSILLLVRAGLRLPVSTLLVAALLCATEAAQVRMVGRTPASTDPVVAALMALVLAQFKSRR